jgi:hypothetical protein
MSFGKSGGTQTVIPTLSPEQNAMLAAQTGLFTGTVGPAYQQAVTGATNTYNQSAPGVTQAAQNLSNASGQAQQALGTTGESALNTGISALQNIGSADYQKNQLQAAMMPAQAQYAQNIANQNAQFGGAGELGSARQALAGQQVAGANQAAQMSALAQAQNNIANQQIQAGSTLGQLGQSGITGAQNAATTGLTAAMAPQQLYNQYASVLFGTPSASYNPSFQGTQGSTTNTTGYSAKTAFGV